MYDKGVKWGTPDSQVTAVASAYNTFNWKVFILSRVAELLIHNEKQGACPLLDENKHTHIYDIKYIYIYMQSNK